jgi:hypothetical protein
MDLRNRNVSVPGLTDGGRGAAYRRGGPFLAGPKGPRMPATTRTYDELRLRFEPRDGAYRVHATAPCGEASGSFELPFADLEIENFVLRASRGAQTHRRMESSQTENARIFGGRLFGRCSTTVSATSTRARCPTRTAPATACASRSR